MHTQIITQKQLKGFVNYSPMTGLFSWKYSRGSTKAGRVAGWTCDDCYIKIQINGKAYGAHRLAVLYMTGNFPEHEIDHINHDALDNRWHNLRSVTHLENGKNQSLFRNNASGHTGVYRQNHRGKPTGKWLAHIRVNGVRIWLGTHATKSDAIAARAAANRKYGFHKNHGAKQQTKTPP